MMNFNELVTTLTDVNSHLLGSATKAVNIAVTLRNWLYGYYIQEYELSGVDRAEYGAHVLEKLAELLQSKHVNASSIRHLKLCRQFYRHYLNFGQTVFAQFSKMGKALPNIGQTPFALSQNTNFPKVPEEKLLTTLSYSHFVELIKVDDQLKRSFYEMECIRGNWSVRELNRQITSLYYERSGLSKDKDKLAKLTNQTIEPYSVQDVIRDPYVFEFLGIKPQEVMLESKLADALTTKLQNFLLELGKGFCFEARNKRILIGDEYFFIDLVMYHRVLKISVLCEIKVGAFKHSHASQLNTYISYYKKHEMHSGDNPPIGILLCTRKNNALVEYALSEASNQLFVSEYKLALPTEEEMKKFIEKQLHSDLLNLVDQNEK
jgi:predicted nuclease of restriction endonuclease-like (RecB) superfamily